MVLKKKEKEGKGEENGKAEEGACMNSANLSQSERVYLLNTFQGPLKLHPLGALHPRAPFSFISPVSLLLDSSRMYSAH